MTTRSSMAMVWAKPRWRGSSRLLDLVVRRGEVGERQRDGDRFLLHRLERHLELLAGLHRGNQVRCDRRRDKAAALLAGLNGKIKGLSFVDLNPCPRLHVDAERQLDQRERRAAVAGHADVD